MMIAEILQGTVDVVQVFWEYPLCIPSNFVTDRVKHDTTSHHASQLAEDLVSVKPLPCLLLIVHNV
jgi:hypothetical protein